MATSGVSLSLNSRCTRPAPAAKSVSTVQRRSVGEPSPTTGATNVTSAAAKDNGIYVCWYNRQSYALTLSRSNTITVG